MRQVTRALIETWVSLYTLGLPESVRRERLDVIRSDLAEQTRDAEPAGESIFLSLAGRWLRGVPADLTWRAFEARGLRGETPGIRAERSSTVCGRATGIPFPFLSISTGVAWALALVIALQGMEHSLAWAGGLLALKALAGWALEARATGDEAPPTAWPLLLAVGIVATAGGVVFDGGRTGLVLAGPAAVVLSVALVRSVAGGRAAVVAEDRRVSSEELAAHAARGDAIAIEVLPKGRVSRRAVLRGSFGVGLASLLAAMGGVFVDFLWKRDVSGFGGVVTAGNVADFPPGTKVRVRQGKFWLVNLSEEQGGAGFLALWQKCPHLGCVVPWDPRFSFVDPESGRPTRGWFRCPCHQSTYNHAGVRVYGPAPRSMDRMAVSIHEDGTIEVDTSDISNGTDDNASHAVRPRI